MFLAYNRIYIIDRGSLKHTLTLELLSNILPSPQLFQSKNRVSIIIKNVDMDIQEVVLQDLTSKDIKPEVLKTLLPKENKPSIFVCEEFLIFLENFETKIYDKENLLKPAYWFTICEITNIEKMYIIDNWLLILAYDNSQEGNYTIYVYPFHNILKRISKLKKYYSVSQYRLDSSVLTVYMAFNIS